MTRLHKIGIIGCGRVADERHLPALQHIAGARIVAAADSDRDRLRTFASKWKIERPFNDFRALLRETDIDAVAILTPTTSHAELAAAALEEDKHLLIEKPLALNLEQCDRLIERGLSTRNTVIVGFNLRWHRLIRRAKSLIQSGALGRIKAIRSSFTHFIPGHRAPTWHKELATGGGVCFNQAVHHFDLWQYLLDTEIDEVFAHRQRSDDFEDETHVTIAKLANGGLASGVFTLSSTPNNDIEILGDRGRLTVSCYRFDGLERFFHTTQPGDLTGRFLRSARAVKEVPAALRSQRLGGDFQATFVGLWRHFLACIDSGQATECTLQDGKRAVAVALASSESAASGRPVAVTRCR